MALAASIPCTLAHVSRPRILQLDLTSLMRRITIVVCKYEVEELCTNKQCPLCGAHCPVQDTAGMCKHEERVDEHLVLTPKGCFIAAVNNHLCASDATIELIWADFADMMQKFGYVEQCGEDTE